MRILHIISELDGGGIEKLLYSYSIHISNEVIFDYAICADHEGILEKRCLDVGSMIFHYPRIKNGFIKTIRALRKIIKNGKYDVVQVHATDRSFVALFAALLAGVKIRIAHSHSFNEPETKLQRIERIFFSMATRFLATNLFACGEEAGKWAWGNKRFQQGKVFVMHNAIEKDDFVFDVKKRMEIRRELGVEDRFVVGNVGRLCDQKNQIFLINILPEIVKKRPETILLLVGNGEMRGELEKRVCENNLERYVMFLGVRKDVNELLNAFDLFVLPSKFEGLPVSLVEVQTNGLAAMVSSRVTTEVKINENVNYLPLEETLWENEISVFPQEKHLISSQQISDSGYDIIKETVRVKDYYKHLVEECI